VEAALCTVAPVDTSLLREEVERLLRAGARWRVTLCGGDVVEGSGRKTFPDGILAEVPNPAQVRKLQRGASGRRTYAFARLVHDSSGALLVVCEG